MHAWDVFIQGVPADAVIEQALAAILGVPPGSVRVLDQIEPDLDVPTGTTALVERSAVRGDAHRHLTVYLQDEDLIARTATRSTSIRLLQDLARRLESPVFVGDGELDPSGFLRIRPDGSIETVTVDDEWLDEAGVFTVLTDAPRSDHHLLATPSGEPPR
jgi:hypothetical protein